METVIRFQFARRLTIGPRPASKLDFTGILMGAGSGWAMDIRGTGTVDYCTATVVHCIAQPDLAPIIISQSARSVSMSISTVCRTYLYEYEYRSRMSNPYEYGLTV